MAERFAAETKNHHMFVVHDDGLYRHLQFRNARYCNDGEWRVNTGFYWFDLITWPGTLVINGDCGTFTFSRVTDMFEFFRDHRVNPQYWAEKVQGETRVKSYNEDEFRRLVTEEFVEAVRHGTYGTVPKGLGKAVRAEILNNGDIHYEAGARAALDAFVTFTADCSCGYHREGLGADAALDWRIEHRTLPGEHHPVTDSQNGFRFTDTWEWDLTDWDWTFLWCLHAIVWGIARYDGEEAPAFEPDPVRTTPVSAVITLRSAPRTATMATTGGVL
jgi:hypothetical protein